MLISTSGEAWKPPMNRMERQHRRSVSVLLPMDGHAGAVAERDRTVTADSCGKPCCAILRIVYGVTV